MAPSRVTEDYYAILGVGQAATAELIKSSYRSLALKLHPDRNNRSDATSAFQSLQKAYETLNDHCARRAYDLLYPSIVGSKQSSPNTEGASHPQASSSSPKARPPWDGAAQIADLRKRKQARATRWSTRKIAFEASIFDVQRSKRRVEQEINNLASIAAAERAEDAAKNSWGTWLLSPLYKQVKETEDEKARKERGRQERKIERDLKERRLAATEVDLQSQQHAFKNASAEVQAADASDDSKICLIEARLRARECEKRMARERAERERQAEIRKQRQQEEEVEARVQAELWRQQMAERQAAARARQEAEDRQRQRDAADEIRQHVARQARQSSCEHYGWWDKVHGRAACPECYDVWTYLLECPQCAMKACPKCQATIRRKRHGGSARASQRVPLRARSPSPDFTTYHDYYWD